MATFYNKDTLQRMLDEKQKQRQSPDHYMNAPLFSTVAPKELDSKPQVFEQYDQMQDDILKGSREATATEMVMARNKFNYEQMKRQQELRKQAQENYVKAQNFPTQYITLPGAGGAAGSPSTGYSKQNWGKDGIPEVSDLKGGLNPNAPIKTVTWRGRSFGINSQVAPIFLAFLDNLARMGYVPKSIGGYANRNIAGTGTKSLHSYGLAIDIDPSRNPVTWNGTNITALPRGVGAMAARYGLLWGGDWKGQKRDTMHFSIPYNHTY